MLLFILLSDKLPLENNSQEMLEDLSLQEKTYLLDFILATGVFLVFVWNIFLQWNLSKIKKNQKILFSGKKSADLEEIILSQRQELDAQKQSLFNLTAEHNKTKKLAFSSIHNVGIIRFNPFRDIGGDQSFSFALLNGQKDGIVVSSLYSREGVRVYAKAVKNGEGVKYPLTNEEKSSIALALQKKN